MAKGKKGRKPNRTTPKRKNPIRRRRTTTKSNGIGTVLHKGIRSVLSLLPGSSVTKPISDIIFNSLGWADDFVINSVTRSKTDSVEANVKYTGLTTTFNITAAAVMGDCASASTCVNESQFNEELRSVSTNFQLARISHFKVTATNAGPSSAHGQWIMAFWPYQGIDMTKMVPYSLNECRAAPYYVEGPSSKTLILKHFFPPSNIYARQFGEYTRAVGVITIVYTETSRTGYEQLSAADFDPAIEIAGSVIMTARSPAQSAAFDNKITSPLTPQLILRTSYGLKKINVSSSVPVVGKGYCAVKGSIWEPDPLRLEEMEL